MDSSRLRSAWPPNHVALTDSTTQGVQIVVTGLGLGEGDEVVTTDAEHFGLTGPLLGAGAAAAHREDAATRVPPTCST